MIRINLLPRTQRKVRVGQRQLGIFLVLVVVEIGAMVFFHMNKTAEVETKQQTEAMLKREIAQLKKEVGDFDLLKRQRDRLLSQRGVIEELKKGRTGPVWMMLELGNILSVGKGPTIKKGQIDSGDDRWNERWNPRRLWILDLAENNGGVRIVGKAKDHDDVAEFLKRLQLSNRFADVRLEQNNQVMDRTLGLQVVQFSLGCRVVK